MKQNTPTNKTTIHLSAEQSQFVADNHNLIYSFLYKQKIPVDDDTYSIASSGLCKAAYWYKPERGAFSTFAYCTMLSEFKHDKLSRDRDKRKVEQYTDCYDFSSYDTDDSFSETPNESLVTMIINRYLKVESFEEEYVNHFTYQEFLLSLDSRQRRVAEMFEQGYTLSEIAKALDCVPSNISYIKNQIKKKYIQYSHATS